MSTNEKISFIVSAILIIYTVFKTLKKHEASIKKATQYKT